MYMYACDDCSSAKSIGCYDNLKSVRSKNKKDQSTAVLTGVEFI